MEPLGVLAARLAAFTPGKSRARFNISSKMLDASAPEWPFAAGSTFNAITRLGWNPRSRVASIRKVRVSRPAPKTITSDNAI
jgi:hypothetical protein